MYTKFIPKNIQEKLKAKERALAYKEPIANEPVDQSSGDVKYIKPQDIQSRTTFVRMCSNKVDSIKNILIAGGKVSALDGKSRFGIKTEVSGLYQTNKNNQIRPVGGIKNIEVNYKGSYKAIREATVNWVVGSIEELDELTPYFLTVGKTVILDWGWVNSNVKNFAQMYNDTPFITWQQEGEYYKVDQSIFTDAQTRVQKMGGDYDAIGGKVSNFEMTMRTDGGFDCVTKITAIGSALFAKPIDRPTNQISLVPKPATKLEKELLAITDPTDQEKIEIEKIKEKITSTDKRGDNIIKHNVLGWPVDGGPLEEVIKNKGFLNFKKNISTGKSAVAEFQNKLYHIKGDYAIAVDNRKNSQVCWMNINGNNKFFVKWGYMEDQIMNRYLSYDAGEGEANDLKITFRSIKTRIDGEGKPISNDLYKEDLDNMPEDGEGTVLIDTDTPNTSEYTVVSNDSLSAIANRYGTTVDILVELNADIQSSSSVINVGQKIILPQSTQEQEDFELLEGMTEDQLYGAGSMMLSAEIQEARDRSANEFMSSLSNAWNIADNFTLNDFAFTDKMPSIDVYDFKKESTKIRNLYTNNNFFYPIDPWKFWSPELLPPEDKIEHRQDDGDGYDPDLQKAFASFYKKLKEDPKKVFSVDKFTPDDNSNVGTLRNMWVNVEEIQKAFGIDITSKSEAKANPPGTFENGIKALLQSLNSNFYGVWDFELAVDPYDSTNMGVIDKKVNNLKNKSLTYTNFASDIEGSTVTDREGNFSHRVNDLGIYKFPSFKAGSIVKNQNLSFKIPDSMALTIMYGSNKPDKTETSNAAYNNPDIMKLFSRQDSKFDDKYLMNMIPSNTSKDESIVAQSVGSHKTNPNSKIVKNSEHGLKLTTNEKWYLQWAGDTQEIELKEGTERKARIQLSFEEGTGNIVEIKEAEITVGSNTTTFVEGNVYTSGDKRTIADEERKGEFENTGRKPKLFKDNYTTSIFKMTKEAEKLIRSRLNGTLKVEENDFLKVDTIIPAELTLEIDGIGGISPGDLVHTNYIQKKYNAEIFDAGKSLGPYTYFQVFGLSQRVDSATWSTELTTKMRINHIPDSENLKLDSKIIKKEIPPIKRPVTIVPTVNEDIANDVTLDDLDFDNFDFESWPKPPPPPPVSYPETNVPSAEVDIGKLVTLDESFNVLPMPIKLVIPDVKRPIIPVPTDDEDIFEYAKEEQNEIDNFGDEYLDEDFSDFKKPPKKVEKIVEKKKEKQKKKKAKEQKVNPKKPDKSTYGGRYEQNSWLYQIREDWRTLYRKQSGTGINSLSGQKQSYNPKQYTTVNNKQVEAYNIVRAQLSFSVRKAWWDENIEAPNASGKSVLTSLADIDLQSIRETGFLRQDKGIYWTGKYNPNI